MAVKLDTDGQEGWVPKSRIQKTLHKLDFLPDSGENSDGSGCTGTTSSSVGTSVGTSSNTGTSASTSAGSSRGKRRGAGVDDSTGSSTGNSTGSGHSGSGHSGNGNWSGMIRNPTSPIDRDSDMQNTTAWDMRDYYYQSPEVTETLRGQEEGR